MKENTQVSTSISTVPINNTVDTSKEYKPLNFGVKDIQTSESKYKTYKPLKKKKK
jgi:hypothetical protein